MVNEFTAGAVKNTRDSQTTREHPQSFGVVDMNIGAPKDHAFIQRIKPYLDDESEFKKNIHFLLDSFNEATSCSKDALVKSSCTAFDSWSSSFVRALEVKLDFVSSCIFLH